MEYSLNLYMIFWKGVRVGEQLSVTFKLKAGRVRGSSSNISLSGKELGTATNGCHS